MLPAFNGTAVWPTLTNYFTAVSASLFTVWFVTLVGIWRYHSIIVGPKRQVVFPDFIFEIVVILFVANVGSEEIVVVFFKCVIYQMYSQTNILSKVTTMVKVCEFY